MSTMVEMRWLERKIPEQPTHGTERVLQYRVKDNWGGHNDDPDWGEWMDVPIETMP